MNMKISTIGDLKRLIVGTVIKDSLGDYYRKDNFAWVFSNEKGADKPNPGDQTEHISLPATVIPQFTLEETVDNLDRENRRLLNKIDELEKRIKKLESSKPKFDFNKTPNDKPWQICNDDNSDLLKQGVQVLNYITKNVSTK